MSIIEATAVFTPRDAGEFVRSVFVPRLESAVRAACERVSQEAKAIVPVDTGALRDSIAVVEPVDSGSAVEGKVEATMHYAPYVEFGTGERGASSPGAGPGPYTPGWPGMPAQPYLRPALDTARDAVLKEFEERLK